jgi:hypothetical protein
MAINAGFTHNLANLLHNDLVFARTLVQIKECAHSEISIKNGLFTQL